MTRRLEPFDNSIFVTTLFVDNVETGEADEFKFHARGWIRNWKRILELTEQNSITPTPTDIVEQVNWTRGNVVDPEGGQYDNETLLFDHQYEGYRIRSERVLRIQESQPLMSKTLVFKDRHGEQVIYTFDENQLSNNYSDLVQVNLNGQNQWIVSIGVLNRHLARTLSALDALIGETDNEGVQWADTGDIGTLA